jgi:hypothetical protein
MAKKKTKSTNLYTQTEKDLNAIKRLLMLLLIKKGATQEELALALQINQEDISRMMPTRVTLPPKTVPVAIGVPA